MATTLQITSAFVLAGHRGENGFQQPILSAVLPSNLILSFRWWPVIAVNSSSIFPVSSWKIACGDAGLSPQVLASPS